MTPLKKARKHQELDALVLGVLLSFRQRGAMQWTDWYQAARTKRGGKRGLATETFDQAVKRLLANGRVRKDKYGCYEGVYNVTEDAKDDVEGLITAGSRDVGTDQSYEALLKAEIEALRTENKRLIDWIMGDADALTVLQSVYQSPESSEYSRIKAAASALAFERPKLTASIGVMVDFRDKVKTARAQSPPIKTIEHVPDK